MDFKHEPNRIYATGSDGNLLAEVTFPQTEEGIVNIDHTFVDKSLAGQGVAGKLMEAAYKEIKDQNQKARLTCSYAVKWFARHEPYRDILAK